MCGVNVGALLCGTCVCFPSSVSARLCGARVLDDVRRGPGGAPAKPAAKSCLAGPKSALGSRCFMIGNRVFDQQILILNRT